MQTYLSKLTNSGMPGSQVVKAVENAFTSGFKSVTSKTASTSAALK